MMRPTCSLFTPLTIVTTGTMSTPALCRFSIAWSFTSNRLPTRRCELAALPTPSNCRYASRRPAAAASCVLGFLANSMPLVAACTLL